MSQLSPTGTSRGGGSGRFWFVTILVALLALGGGFAAGIWWSDRDSDDATGTPTNCPSSVAVAPTYPAPATVTVNVYNATERQGLARSTADQMATRGYVLGQVTNDPKGATIPGTAEVRHGPTGLAAAQLVALNVEGAVLIDDQRADATVDLAVGEAFQALVAPETVTAATAAPSPSPLPSGCPTPTAVPVDPAATPTPTP